MNNKKSFKATVTHKDTSVSIDAKDVTGYDLGLAGVVLAALLVMMYVIRSKR